MRAKSIIKYLLSTALAVSVMLSVSMTAFAVDEDYMAEHGEEGQRLWERFLEVSEGVEYPAPDTFAPQYEEYTMREQEEFFTFSPHNVWLWGETVLAYVSADKQASWDRIRGREEEFIRKREGENGEIISAAYHDLIVWQNLYWEHTGRLYNFMENKDSLDYINEHYNSSDSDTVISSEAKSGIDSSVISSTSESVFSSSASVETTSNTASNKEVSDVSSVISSKATASYLESSNVSAFGANKGKKSNAGVIVIAVIAVMAVGAGAFYMGKRSSKSTDK